MKALITLLVSALSAWLLQMLLPLLGAILGGLLSGLVLGYKLKTILSGSFLGGAILWLTLTLVGSSWGGAEVIGGLLGVPTFLSYVVTAVLGGILVMLGAMCGHYLRKAMNL